MAVSNVIQRLTLDNTWRKIELGTNINTGFLIAIKETATAADTIKVDEVKQIRFEIGIDSGVENKPIVIQNIVLDFNYATSSDPEFNKISAFTKIANVPSTIYIKPVSVEAKTRVTTGETAIGINLNAVALGAN